MKKLRGWREIGVEIRSCKRGLTVVPMRVIGDVNGHMELRIYPQKWINTKGWWGRRERGKGNLGNRGEEEGKMDLADKG